MTRYRGKVPLSREAGDLCARSNFKVSACVLVLTEYRFMLCLLPIVSYKKVCYRSRRNKWAVECATFLRGVRLYKDVTEIMRLYNKRRIFLRYVQRAHWDTRLFSVRCIRACR
jgi:hypothetical protein